MPLREHGVEFIESVGKAGMRTNIGCQILESRRDTIIGIEDVNGSAGAAGLSKEGPDRVVVNGKAVADHDPLFSIAEAFSRSGPSW